MRNITKVKTILILMMAIMLLVVPVNVFGTTDLNDYLDGWENLELEDEQTTTTPDTTTSSTPDTTTPPTTTTPDTTTPSTNTNTNTNKNESLPQAGLAEDTMMVVAIVVLGATAIYAYRKINQYNNI